MPAQVAAQVLAHVAAQVLPDNLSRAIAAGVVAVLTLLVILWDFRSRYGIVPGSQPA